MQQEFLKLLIYLRQFIIKLIYFLISLFFQYQITMMFNVNEILIYIVMLKFKLDVEFKHILFLDQNSDLMDFIINF